ncbi:MAG: SDR family oxidoreductase [Caldilineaceae bacterium]|nr:SDR family oxidoreductase [Caldilineaceae bacterium]
MNAKRFDGKVAVVTGAASGIGEAISRQLLSEGARVVAADINAERLAKLEAEFSGNLVGVVTDVTKEDAVAAMVATAVERFGGLDVAFNVAGAARAGAIVDLAESDWDFTVDLVLKGVFLSTKHEAKQMQKSGVKGAIVNISSLNAHVPMFGGSAYAAAKAGVEMFTKNAALELGRDGIRVNAILPGLVQTPLTSGMTGNEALNQDFINRIPLGRSGVPDDIASPAVFLASDAAAYVTGTSLVVDGGWEITNYPDLSKYM